MFTTATIGIPNPADAKRPAVVRLDLTPPPSGPAVIALPSGGGKSSIIAGIERVLTGEPGPEVVATTAKGSYRVGPKARTITRGEDEVKYTSAADYRAALPLAFRDPRLSTLIIRPSWWLQQYRGGVGGVRALADALLLALPAGSVLDIIREGMGPDWREEDPADIKGAQAAQAAANKASDLATGGHTREAEALARARATLAACVEVDVSAERATMAAAEAWRVYDTAAAAWTAHDEAVTGWTARKPGAAPAYSAEAHETIRGNVARLEAQARQEEAEEAARVAAAEATAKAEAKAAREAEAARVAAEKAQAEAVAAEARKPRPNPAPEPSPPAPPPAAPAPSLFASAPKSTACPACSGTGRIPA